MEENDTNINGSSSQNNDADAEHGKADKNRDALVLDV
jgi:hypothetical protein